MVLGFIMLLRLLNNNLNGFQPCIGVTLNNIGYVPPVYFCYPLLFGICQNPWEVNTTFTLYNSDTKDDGVQFEYPFRNLYKLENIWREAVWNVFIVHGYNSNMDRGEQLFKKMKDMYIRRLGKQVNVVLVDWRKGAIIDYQAAVANIQVVGKQIAFMIQEMKKNAKLQVNLRMTVLIGHSLGAHIMGIAGRNIHSKTAQKVAKIVGLDPAGPCIENSRDHISDNDAEVVEILHTNSGNFGTSLKCGHYDFYPNSGKQQPGCEQTYLPDVVEDICDHIRVSKLLAVDHHREGICQPVAYQCDDYASFTKGFCASCNNNECRPFGLSIQFDVNVRIPQSEVADKGYYFKTSGKSPYCVHHYQVRAKCYSQDDCEGITIYFKGETWLWFSAKVTKMKENIYTGLLTINSSIFRRAFKVTLATFSTVNVARQFEEIEVTYMSNLNNGNEFYSKLCRRNLKGYFQLCG